MILIFLCLVVTFAGPFLARLASRAPALNTVTDSFIVVALAGIVVFHLLPQGLAAGGLISIGFGLLGLAVPPILERLAFSKDTPEVQKGALLFALSGLLLHAFTDGAALVLSEGALLHFPHEAADHGHTDDLTDNPRPSLLVGVLLHRLPVALGVYWMGCRWSGPRGGWVALVGLGLATTLGFIVGDHTLQHLNTVSLASFQTFVAGSLLHVVVDVHTSPHSNHTHHHRSESSDTSHSHSHDHRVLHSHDTHNHNPLPGAKQRYSFLGVTLATAVLYIMSHTHTPVASPESLSAMDTLWTLLFESAPALLLAYIGAGLLTAFFGNTARRWLRGTYPLSQAARGVAFGLPMPVCSCGVLPLYETLVRKGVPASAAIAFLISTPELGLDAVLISLPLLGTELTFARVIAAIAAALIVSTVVARVMTAPKAITDDLPPRGQTYAHRLVEGLRFGLIDLVDHTAPWILVGLVAAAIIEPVVDYEQLSTLSAYLDVPLFALLGIPIYVCASGATPLAAVLIHKGISPGAAIAFLLTGPATNLTTFGVLTRLHGRRAAWVFGVTMMVVAIGLGYTTNLLLGARLEHPLHDLANHAATAMQTACFALLSLLFAYSVWRRGPRAVLGEVFSQGH